MPVQVTLKRNVYADPPWAEKYVRVPYAERGADFSGAHCAGLVRLAFREERGIDLPDTGMVPPENVFAAAGAIRHVKTLRPWQQVAEIEPGESGEAFANRVTTARLLREFDVATMLRSDPVRGRFVEGHLGLMIGWRALIHVEQMTGTVKQRLTDATLNWRLIGFYRHEALT